MVALKCNPIQIRHSICHIKLYISDTNGGDINPENMCDDVNILSPVIYLFIILNIENKVYNNIHMKTLILIHISCAREVFHDEVIFFTWAAPYITI